LSSVLKVDQIQSDTGTVNISSNVVFSSGLTAGSAAAPSIFPTGDTNTGIFFPAADTIAFAKGGAEAMRIDSAGNLLVGKTTTATADVGMVIGATGFGTFTRDGFEPLTLNRKTSVGDIATFRKDGTAVGSIGVISTSNLYIVNPAEGLGLGLGQDNWYATNGSGSSVDNSIDLGDLTVRFDDVYATNGTIQTSDANEKQDIEALSEAETRVAVAAKSLLKKYRWKDAVAEKGDDARIHFGIIAQDLKAAFEAEGLDAGRYAMFIHSAWWETQTEVPAVEANEENDIEAKEAYTRIDTYQTEAEAPEGAVKKERMGIRYNELLAFMVAAL
jgi:hypothetical protein